MKHSGTSLTFGDGLCVLGPRPTKDVDVILDVDDLLEFSETEKQLRKRGFHTDPGDDAPVCRLLLKSTTPGTDDVPAVSSGHIPRPRSRLLHGIAQSMSDAAGVERAVMNLSELCAVVRNAHGDLEASNPQEAKGSHFAQG